MKRRTAKSLNIGVSVLLFITSLTLRSQSAPSAGVHLAQPHQQRVFDIPSGTRRRWSNNALISFHRYEKVDKQSVQLYDENGRLSREAMVSLPDAREFAIVDATGDSSGSLYLSGGANDAKGRVAHFIAQLNDSGQVSKVVRTTPFMARLICAPKHDGTIWAYGGDQGNVRSSPVLEEYSLDKGLLKALFPRTELGPEWTGLDGPVPDEAIHLVCNDQKVVLFNAESDTLLEYDLSSDKAIRQQITPLSRQDVYVTGLCITKEGVILSSLLQKSHQPPLIGVFQLNMANSRSAWMPLEETVHPAKPGSELWIVGTNGTDLVYKRSFEDSSLSWATLTH